MKNATYADIPNDNMSSSEIKECEHNVIKALTTSPRIQALIQALKYSSCPFDVSRHVICSPCDKSLSGGYDDEHNQIIICANNCRSYTKTEAILAHEMVHMYDFCKNLIDFANPLHLACSEIRAASLASCAQLDLGYKSYQSCVKSKASQSVSIVLGWDKLKSAQIVEKVFQKCFHDVEPLGRHSAVSVSQSDFVFCSRLNKE